MEPRGLSPSPSTQTTEKQQPGRQATLISYSIKSSFKAKVTDFFRNSETHSFPHFRKDAASPSSDNLPRHICEQDFFCLPDKHEDYTAYSLHRDEAGETLRS